MGISTIQSYRGAQIFEAVGLKSDFVDRYFTWTPSRIGGIGLEEVAAEVLTHHNRAFTDKDGNDKVLDSGGEYQWRNDGEEHLFNPQTIHTLQHAVRTGDYNLYKKYAKLVQGENDQLLTIRSMLKLKPAGPAVPLEEVESVESIMRRFKTGAMSFGSISKEAHEDLAIAMNRVVVNRTQVKAGRIRLASLKIATVIRAAVPLNRLHPDVSVLRLTIS